MCPPPRLFPMKAAGLYHVGSKGPDGAYSTEYRPVRSPQREKGVPRMRLIFSPLERMSDEAEIPDVKTARRGCETGAASETRPER